MKITTATLIPGLILFTATLACAQAPESAASAGSEPLATFTGGAITTDDVEAEGGAQLVKLYQQLHDAKVKIINDIIFNRLLAEEAGKQNMSADDYLQKVVKEPIEEPTDEQIAAVLNQYRSKLPEDEAKARGMVVNHLRQQSEQQAMERLRRRLLAKADVKIHLDPPRIAPVVQAHNPVDGAAEAPITMIEYTDFQCPYCSRVQDTVKKVKERYGDSLRHVFKHLPLPMHRQARLAAEASLCAADQGQFWPMHDWMFANASNLGRDVLVDQAKAMGLDDARFTACVDDQVHTDHVAADMAEAHGFGITGTPGFVINGRLISGAQPYDAFTQIIDDELRRAGLPVPPAAAPVRVGS